MPEARSKFDVLKAEGLNTIDESDWAAEAQKRVAEGSDGLWVHLGPDNDGSVKAQFTSFNFNPCVSFFSLVLLFGLVGLCSLPPGEYCTKQTPTYMWTNSAGTSFAMQERTQVVGDPSPPAGAKLLEQAGGGGSATAGVFGTKPRQVTYHTYDSSTNKWTKDATAYTYSTETRLQAQDCFAPKKEFAGWMNWTTEQFTWLMIITQDVWIVFLAIVAYKYGKIKIGRDDDVPEFNNFQFFAMLFTCGVATGLFFFAVTEPQYYYLAGKTFNGAGKVVDNKGYYERNRIAYSGVFEDPATGKEVPVWSTPNDRITGAMTLMFYHWGLHGWVCYCLLGLLLGFMHFRKGLPLTIKSCFYPLIGNRIYGFCGDFVDTISVVATTMGVCTSLGMGVMQLNSGIEYLNGGWHWFGESYYNSYNKNDWKSDLTNLKTYWDNWPEATRPAWFDVKTGEVNLVTAGKVADLVTLNDQQMFLVVMISIAAATSVLLGLKNGIKNLAVTCLVLGQFLIFYVWMMDDTYFIMNLLTQAVGDYMQKLPALGFYASAVEQSEVNNPYGEYSSWQRWWTIFYWGWWIAWCPFVGVFIARIGRGRTVREFIFCTLGASVLYNFAFLSILGGAGLKMQLLAEKYEIGTASCAWDAVVHGSNPDYYRMHPFKKNICRAVSSGKYSTESEMFCSTVTNIACSLKMDGSMPLFDVVGQYGEMGTFMVVLTLIALTLYFVASSDSGSMTDDMICANGLTEPNLIQRLIWASTECAAACALLSVGKYIGSNDGALRAFRAISIVVGIPYTFLCCIMMLSLWRALQYETGERTWGEGFRTSAVDIGVTLYQCGESAKDGVTQKFNFKKGLFDKDRFIQIVTAAFAPIVAILKITIEVDHKTGDHHKLGRKFGALGAAVFFYVGWLLILCDFAPPKDGPVQWGAVNGNATDPAANFRYYTSNRYGYYHQWANEDVEFGDAIKWNTEVVTKANEVALKADINGVSTDVGVGPASAKSRRIASIGWFFILCMFFGYITQLRSEVRAIYGIKGNIFEDYMCAWFWPGCLAQMAAQVQQKVVAAPQDAPKEAPKDAPTGFDGVGDANAVVPEPAEAAEPAAAPANEAAAPEPAVVQEGAV